MLFTAQTNKFVSANPPVVTSKQLHHEQSDGETIPNATAQEPLPPTSSASFLENA